LTVINGYAALALQEVAPSTPTWSKLSEVKKAGDQAAGLTHQLLAFSRKQVLQPRAVNLDALLQDMMQMIRRIVGDSVQVSSKTSDRIGSVKIDPTQVQQVILNLAVNARDAMPKGGLLHFELSHAAHEEGDACTDGFAPEGRVTLIVTDTGCGMTPEVKQRVFEPFFTTKELGRGTGLGLATVHGIVEQSGGRISIDSELGVGTKFTILFPCCADAVEVPAAMESSAIQAGHETILLVEDDDAIRALTSDVLTRAGYRVLAAESGAAAIQLGADYAEMIDLLLTDMSMPGMTGSNLAQRLHGTRPDASVLYMSGYSETIPVAIDGRNGSPEFLSKPFTPVELTAKVRKVLAKRRTVKRILVVDDEQPIRSLLKEILEGAGFEVFTASNGREAKHQLIDNPVDLVITDLIMPEMEGIEFIAAMRKERPHLKLIAITGGAGLDFLRAAHILGAHATLPKPLTPEALLSCVNQLAV
jgi:two-component system cell cycle sensor histidine kinase/response regulator CckA